MLDNILLRLNTDFEGWLISSNGSQKSCKSCEVPDLLSLWPVSIYTDMFSFFKVENIVHPYAYYI